MDRNKWIPVNSMTSDNGVSRKSLVDTDFTDVSTTVVKVGKTHIRYSLNGLWEENVLHDGVSYVTLRAPEIGNIQKEGAPSLPQEGLFVALPFNAVFKGLRVIDYKFKVLDGEILILPAPKPAFEGEPLRYIPDAAIYQSDNMYPGKIAEYIGTNELGGVKVVHVLLYLAQYLPKLKKISLLDFVDLEIFYEIGGKDFICRQKKVSNTFSSLILGYEEPVAKNEYDDKVLESSYLKAPENSGEFLIVTVNDFKNSFDTFVAAKSSKYKVKVVTKEQILVEFPDPKENVAIRNFLIYATQKWTVPPQYVILGGNIDKIPTCIRNHSGEPLPSDHYYADLNDDMLPDICVSRFPASTVVDMKKLCDTAASYHNQYGTWRNDTLLTTFNRADYNKCKDTIAGSITPVFNPVKRYDGVATKAEVITTINNGVGFINYRGHGGETCWQAGNGLTNADILSLNNTGRLPHVLSIACNNNAIDYKTGSDYNCFGITWLKNQKAISFLGASRPSYTVINDSFDKYLWEAIKVEKKETISEIFNWATAKLYLNNPSDLSKHNIYMYLLLGDPTANYNEKVMPTQKTTGFVLMLDRSASMKEAIGQVKINANAFVQKAWPGDQFGVNEFSNDADWVYPTGKSPAIATVSDDLHETAAAVIAINKIVTQNMTNMGAAISIGNELIKQATTDVKAFVLLSDGYSNYGSVSPEQALGVTPPLYVAGLGPILRKEYFDKLLSKNPNSQYFHSPIGPEMEEIFNQIRGLTPNTNMMANQSDKYVGSGYTLVKAMVNTDSENVQFSIAWADKQFKYTSGYPKGYNINVVLIEPGGHKSNIRPTIVGEGYCIFNLQKARPGEWSIVVQYSLENATLGITGAFQFGTSVKMNIDAPKVLSIGQPLNYKLDLLDGNNPIEGVTVDARIIQPIISVDNALVRYANALNKVATDESMLDGLYGNSEEVARLQTLRMQKIKDGYGDILGVKSSTNRLAFSTTDGIYESTFSDTLEAGSYTLEFNVSGVDVRTGKNISMVKRHSLLIG